MNALYFITGNKGKFSEVKEKLQSIDIKIIQKDLGYPEIQADSLEEVAKYGVDHIKKGFNEPFILEDAGIFIDVFDGFPGVFSKYVYYTIGLKGILKLLDGVDNRGAVFRSVYAYSEPDKIPLFFIGECKGSITRKEKGTGGFGYDPIFIPEGKSITFAEMKRKEKNMISHRGKALAQLITYLQR